MKQRWIVVLAILGLLVIGIAGGVVLAQDSGTGGEADVLTENDGTEVKSVPQSFTARVAAILGLEEQVVKDAFRQAGKEKQNEAYQARLDGLVAKGRLTEGEAAEQYSWFQARPDSSAGIFRGTKHRRPGFGYHRFSRGRHRGIGPMAPGYR